MTFKKLISYLILLLFTNLAFGQAGDKHSVKNLHEDFKILRGALEESHPGIYWYRSKSELDKAFDTAYAELDHEMTELEFYRILAPLISKIGCGHTWIATTESTQEKLWATGRVLPLKLKFISGEAYCVENNSSDSTSIQSGDQILKINDYTVDSLLKLSNKFSPGDGFIQIGKWRILDNVFNQFFTLYIGQPDDYRIKFKKRDGQVKDIVIGPLTLKEIETTSRIRYPDKKQIDTKNVELSFLSNDSTALLRIKEFSDWKSGSKKFQFGNELKAFFQKIDSSKAQNLIIDLRNNDGGNEKYGLLLYSYLTDKPFIGYKQIDFRTTHFSFRKYTTTSWFQIMLFKTLLRPKKINDTTYLLTNNEDIRIHEPNSNHFDGDIYVLINRGTFSTASDFAALVNSNRIATFIGEETGGSYYGNTSNYSFLMTLPNTKIKVNIPVARYQTNVAVNNNFGKGVIPDHQIQYSIEDIIQGFDRELDTVLTLLKN
jgi:C-terminal processing protease CtpA/Prc